MAGVFRHASYGALVVVAIVLSGCSAPSALHRTASTTTLATGVGVVVDLRTRHIRAGDPIRGILVVRNSDAAINLTQAEETESTDKCEPGFAVILTRGSFRNRVGFAADCSNRAFIISHGITRIPFQVFTSYTQCQAPGRSSEVSGPTCSLSGGPPPLPAGSYETAIEWSEPVPLPDPAPVVVVLH